MPEGAAPRADPADLAGLGRTALRFGLSGGLNTVLTWGLYGLLLRWLPYGWSYSLAFAAGIALAYALGRYLVFRRPGVRGGPLWVALIYLGQYLLGLALVQVWVAWWQAPALWAPLFATALSLPLNFLLQRQVFRPGRGPA